MVQLTDSMIAEARTSLEYWGVPPSATAAYLVGRHLQETTGRPVTQHQIHSTGLVRQSETSTGVRILCEKGLAAEDRVVKRNVGRPLNAYSFVPFGELERVDQAASSLRVLIVTKGAIEANK